MNYLIVGFKAAGKSTLGKALARRLGLEFIDLDQIIEAIDNQKRNCREIFNQSGENYFREMENKALFSLKEKDNVVIALGGGALEREDNCQIVKELGTVIYLEDDKNVVFARMKAKGLPNFIDSNKTFETLYSQRSAKYQQIAKIKIEGKDKTVEQIVNEVVSLLKQ